MKHWKWMQQREGGKGEAHQLPSNTYVSISNESHKSVCYVTSELAPMMTQMHKKNNRANWKFDLNEVCKFFYIQFFCLNCPSFAATRRKTEMQTNTALKSIESKATWKCANVKNSVQCSTRNARCLLPRGISKTLDITPSVALSIPAHNLL